jgi:RNA polymerase sigma factor (sigma-70 family)
MESNILEKQFTQLYTDEADAVYRFCFLRTSDKEVAINLMQDTFMRFWQVLSREKVKNDRAFLFTIARNRIIDWYREKKSLSLESLAEKSGMETETFMDLVQSQEQTIEMNLEARFLMDKIQELDPMFQQVIYFRYVENFGPKDIAEILGVSVNVVSVRIHRGIQQLRKVAKYDET